MFALGLCQSFKFILDSSEIILYFEKLKAIFFGAKLFITLIGDPEKRLNAAKSCNPRFESLLPKDVRTSIRNFVLTLEN